MDARSRRTGIIVGTLIALLVVIGFLVLRQPLRQQDQSNISASITSSSIPSPEETSNPSPLPTETLAPTYTWAPLPRPPAPTILAGTQSPSPEPSPLATLTQVVTPERPKSNTLATTNIAWGVETANDLTIWTGVYSDNPTPSMSDAKAIVKWTLPLKLIDIAVSPDHQSLAVLTVEPLTDREGFPTYWLSVINLSNYAVQSIPDYDDHYDLYEYYYPRTPNRILGWIDNDRFAVQQTAESAPVIATKDGASYAKSFLALDPAAAHDTALSPNRDTFFAYVVSADDKSGYWLYNIDGSNPHQIVDRNDVRELYYPTWSPDGKYISFLTPKVFLKDDAKWGDTSFMGVWLLDMNNYALKAISSEDVWDVDPVWSDDSSKIAFLRSDEPIGDKDVWFTSPEKMPTNIFTVETSDLIPHQLTQFSDVNNSDLQWTPGGSLILASNTGSSSGQRNLGVVSTSNGAFTTLVTGSTGESLVNPMIFK